MITQLLTLSLLTYTTFCGTKHFIGEYIIPLGDTPRIAFPIDKCFNYEATISAEIKFGKYRCQGTDTVTFTSFGEDPTCAGASAESCPDGKDESFETIGCSYTMDTLNPGDLYSFSCTGDDNYAEINSCTTSKNNKVLEVGDDGEIACCSNQTSTNDDNAGCLSQLQGTEVCIKQADDTYVMIACDNSTVVTNAYESTDTDCSGTSTGVVSTQYYDFCSYYQTVPFVEFKVYRRAIKCFDAGVDIAPDDEYCPYVTVDPTMTPSVSPTASTKAPTDAPTEADPGAGNWYGILYGVVMGVVVGIWM